GHPRHNTLSNDKSHPKVAFWWPRPETRGSGPAVDDLLQFTGLVHLHHDVRSADELALDVELWNRGPIAVFLDALANAFVFQHVHRFQGAGLDTAGLEDLDGAARKTAHGEAGIALHEEHHVARFDDLVDLGLCVAHGRKSLIRWV